jgi:hypothetical protein
VGEGEGGSDIARFFIECAIAEASGLQPDARTIKKLAQVLHTLAIVSAGSRAGENLVFDKSFVGYVRTQCEGLAVYIPFHLAAFFPTGTTLAELIGISQEVALDNGDPICLSGSATFLGASNAISDLDYCEYYLDSNIRNPAKFVEGGWNKSNIRTTIVRTRCLSTTYVRPWPSLPNVLRVFEEQIQDDQGLTIKTDAICLSDLLGPLPVSNLVLLLARAMESGAANKTHVFQEAVLTKGEGPPRTLVNANGLGRYLNFLRRDARKFSASEPLKSLKRSLSFFLLTAQHQPARAIIAVLQSELAEVLARVKRQTDTEDLLREMPVELQAAVAPKVSVPKIAVDVVAMVKALAYPKAQDLAASMLDLIDESYIALEGK